MEDNKYGIKIKKRLFEEAKKRVQGPEKLDNMKKKVLEKVIGRYENEIKNGFQQSTLEKLIEAGLNVKEKADKIMRNKAYERIIHKKDKNDEKKAPR